ncbi:hypothetical protein ERJ75_001067600 [Trypanosoma vivax]|nr:hypothetical protein ERJ75_001067600 [Trypanosoma vivax]
MGVAVVCPKDWKVPERSRSDSCCHNVYAKWDGLSPDCRTVAGMDTKYQCVLKASDDYTNATLMAGAVVNEILRNKHGERNMRELVCKMTTRHIQMKVVYEAIKRVVVAVCKACNMKEHVDVLVSTTPTKRPVRELVRTMHSAATAVRLWCEESS